MRDHYVCNRWKKKGGGNKNHGPVRIVEQTREGVVPGHGGGQQAEETAGFDHGRVGLAGGVAVQVADAEEEEGRVEEEEEDEEGDGRAEGAQ